MTIELKPCPFCGSDPDGPHYSDGYGDIHEPHYWIECSNAACGLLMQLPAPEEFIVISWNSRAHERNIN